MKDEDLYTFVIVELNKRAVNNSVSAQRGICVIVRRRHRNKKRRAQLWAAFDTINLIHFLLFCRMFCLCIFAIIQQCVKLIQREIFKVLVAVHVQSCVL